MEEVYYNETVRKIQKRIATLSTLHQERPKELFITKEEMNKLNGIKKIDNVVLKTYDCFAYIEKSHACYALNHLYCQNNPNCSFYKNKNEYSIQEAELAIKKYSGAN